MKTYCWCILDKIRYHGKIKGICSDCYLQELSREWVEMNSVQIDYTALEADIKQAVKDGRRGWKQLMFCHWDLFKTLLDRRT